MRILFLILLLCQCAAGQFAGMQGTVIDSVTRRPLAGAHLTLICFPTDNSQPEDVYGAISRRDGHFSIANMKPGSYVVNLKLNGFTQAARISVALKPGEQLTDYTLEMAARAVISGRVTDEFGIPARNFQVQAMRVQSGTAMTGSTDERGQYRITGAPGKYRVKVDNLRAGFMGGVAEVRSDGTQPAVYGTTWYPAAASEEHGSVIELAAGQDATGIDIRLAGQRSLNVSGTVTGLPNNSTRAFLFLAPPGGDPQFQKMLTAIAATDGKFVFTGVAPGSYQLTAQTYGSEAPLRSPAVDVRVDNSDETGVRLSLSAGEELSGTVEMADEKAVVMLEPLTRTGAPVSAEVDKQGGFKMHQVFPGKLRVRVDPLPENGYVKSVKVDGVEAPDGVLDFTRGVRNSGLKIVVSRNGGQVEGRVTGDDGKPSELPMVFVVLAEKPDDIGYQGKNMKRVPAGGKFSFKGLGPGKYRLFAVDSFTSGNLLEDVKGAFAKAPEVVVREGDRVTHEAKLIGKEKPGAK